MTDKKSDISESWFLKPLPEMHDHENVFMYGLPVENMKLSDGKLDDEQITGIYESAVRKEALFYYRNVKKNIARLELASPISLMDYHRRMEKGHYSRLRCVFIDAVKFRRVNGFSEQDWKMLGDVPTRRAFRLGAGNLYDEWLLLTLKVSSYSPEEWMQIPYVGDATKINYIWQPKLSARL